MKYTSLEIPLFIVVHNISSHNENLLIKGPQTFNFKLTWIATTKTTHGFNYHKQIDQSSLIKKNRVRILYLHHAFMLYALITFNRADLICCTVLN